MWKKVIGPALFVSVVWIIGSSITTWKIHQIYRYYTRALSDNLTTVRDAWAALESLWKLQAIVEAADDRDPRQSRAEMDKEISSFERYLAATEKTCFTPPEKALAKTVRERFVAYRDEVDACVRSPEFTNPNIPHPEEKERTMRVARAVAEPLFEIVKVNEGMIAESNARSSRIGHRLDFVRFDFVVLGPVLGVFFGLWVAYGLHRAISQISITLKDVEGDASHEIGSVEMRAPADLPGLHQQVQVVADRFRRVMEELQSTRRRAMSAQRLAAVGELAAGIAHELRNPLTSVKLLIQTVEREIREQPAADDLRIAQREINRVEGAVQGLLDFARPPELHRVPHDLRTTLRRALNLVCGRAGQQGVSIADELPDAAVRVNGDPEQLHQIFVNLLLNAIEAMPDGGILNVAIQIGRPTAGRCEVSVADSGTGIPPWVLQRMFEPFVTSKERGTGLGLAICHRIAQEHGGTLLAANREEGGAVFTLELPLCGDGAKAGLLTSEVSEIPEVSLPRPGKNGGEAVDAEASGH